MLPQITTYEQAESNILQLNNELAKYPALQKRLSCVQSFYVIQDINGRRLFGFSKYCGFNGVNASVYLSGYRMMNGRSTERALANWFCEVAKHSDEYKTLWFELRDWLAQYEKLPRRSVRISVRRTDDSVPFLGPVKPIQTQMPGNRLFQKPMHPAHV